MSQFGKSLFVKFQSNQLKFSIMVFRKKRLSSDYVEESDHHPSPEKIIHKITRKPHPFSQQITTPSIEWTRRTTVVEESFFKKCP
ncbi:hypothetical protein SNEBB_002231 [Seison nebaliae]|nr:hypothetical protein SNEBB_002231 [Seison nebaliae]